jgi:hypothetical protein
MSALREQLEAAAAGLVYSSESDRPFEFFSLPLPPGDDGALTAERFARLVGAPIDAPTGERTLDAFFARHLERSDPYDAEAQRLRPRYERLKKTLSELLRDVRVFRVGRTEVRCYVVGRDAAGGLAGLTTVAVET